jgi:hypothetical protein
LFGLLLLPINPSHAAYQCISMVPNTASAPATWALIVFYDERNIIS